MIHFVLISNKYYKRSNLFGMANDNDHPIQMGDNKILVNEEIFGQICNSNDEK